MYKKKKKRILQVPTYLTDSIHKVSLNSFSHTTGYPLSKIKLVGYFVNNVWLEHNHVSAFNTVNDKKWISSPDNIWPRKLKKNNKKVSAR